VSIRIKMSRWFFNNNVSNFSLFDKLIYNFK
jgi:hypothetical protein